MKKNNTKDFFPLGGENQNSDRIIRNEEIGNFIGVEPDHQFGVLKTDSYLPEVTIKQYNDNCKVEIVQLPIRDIELSHVHLRLYNSDEKRQKIEELKESIKIVGQLQPVVIIRHNGRNYLMDGRLRQIAMMELDYEYISVIMSPSVEDGDTLDTLVTQHHIRKELTVDEKLNEVIEILQIGRKEENKYIGMDKRRKMLSFKLGKGFSVTNLKKLEKIIQFEMENGYDFLLSKAILNNTINFSNGEEIVNEIVDSEYTSEYESKHDVLKGFVNKKYDLDEAVKNLFSATKKNIENEKDGGKPKIYPWKSDNYEIRQGDIFEIDLTGYSFDVVMTSPPYALQRKYGDNVNEIGVEKDVDEYIQNLVDVFEKAYKQLNDKGSIFVNLNDTWKDGFSLNVIEKFVVEMEKRGIRKVQMIQWEKPNPKPQGSKVHRFLNKFEYIIHFAKNQDYVWNKVGKKKTNLKIQSGCKEVGSDKKNYSIPEFITASTNLLSENMIEGIDGLGEFTTSLKNNPMILKRQFESGEKKHTATFNVLLPLIPLMSTLPKDRQAVVFDPFAGTSTTGETTLAIGGNHKFIGVELYEYNCKTSARVLSQSEEKFKDFNLMDNLYEVEYLNVA